jgi:glycosyltransferase involved in cell wall biosynthesis
MRIVHLMASPFLGGPEKQVLGVARHLPGDVETCFLSFAEGGKAQPFLDEARRLGFAVKALSYNTPRYFACVREVADELREQRADLLCCSGYKPDLVGWRAARRVGIPVVAIAHGWTAATWRVRCYEWLDRFILNWMDAVVCVSHAQAVKARAAGVGEAKLAVIHNAIGDEAFIEAQSGARQEMAQWFAQPPRWIIGAVGRLSPEKGFVDFIEAAGKIVQQRPEAGFVLFGDGPLRTSLESLAAKLGLQGKFVFAGFRNDLGRWVPNLDVNVISSYTEGLPVALLEASAAGVPTVATAVGGIPEVITDGQDGCLVAAGDPANLARRVIALLDDTAQRHALGQAARDRVRRDFLFSKTSRQYHALFQRLIGR